MTRALLGVGLIVLLAALLRAQQPVTVTNVGYDPCLDPNRITINGINLPSATNVTRELIPASGMLRISICSLQLQADGGTYLYVAFGTMSLCSVATTFPTFLNFYPHQRPARIRPGSGTGTVFRGPAGDAFCIYQDQTAAIKGHVRFVQE